jgi:hypothetical protein
MNWSGRAFLILVLGFGLAGGWFPSDLRAAPPATSSISLLLSWSGAGNETGFGIDRAPSLNGPWRTVATVPATQTTYLDNGLQATTTYYYRVWAYNAMGHSDYSNIASITTPTRTSSQSPPGISSTAATGSTAGGGITSGPTRGSIYGRRRSSTINTNLVRPVIAALGRSGGRFLVSFGGTNGLRYSLEYKNSLGDSNWTPVAGHVRGTNGAVSLTDSNAPSGGRFYRVRVELIQ